MRILKKFRGEDDPAEREKIRRLEAAEEELSALLAREKQSLSYLARRSRRNHWREGIEQMIRGEA